MTMPSAHFERRPTVLQQAIWNSIL